MLEVIKKLKMNQRKDRNSPLLSVPFLAPLQKNGIQICDCIEGIETLQTIQPYERLICGLLEWTFHCVPLIHKACLCWKLPSPILLFHAILNPKCEIQNSDWKEEVKTIQYIQPYQRLVSILLEWTFHCVLLIYNQFLCWKSPSQKLFFHAIWSPKLCNREPWL